MNTITRIVAIGGALGLTVGMVHAQQPQPAQREAAQPHQVAGVQAALGTAFTWQGQLKKNGSPVNGACDMQFSLWNAETGGSQTGSTQDKLNVSVNNGLFTTQLDFGEGVLQGDARWLEIAVRCPAGSGTYTTLAPRQKLTPAPYALALPGLWTQQTATSPNVIGGYSGNVVSAGVSGATIAGGGNDSAVNSVTASYGAIGGGSGNTASGTGATVGGGGNNTAGGWNATIAGGGGNTASGMNATVGGGYGNLAGSGDATVAGGHQNAARAYYASIGGGYRNIISDTANYATIAGGRNITVTGEYASVGGGQDNNAAGQTSTIGGGARNTTSNMATTIGGGVFNIAAGLNSTIGGGTTNTAGGDSATVGGGSSNTASGNQSAVGGGSGNTASGTAGTIGGGSGNTASGDRSTISGGGNNTASGMASTIGGGSANSATANGATIGGGANNTVSGWNATIAGGGGNSARSTNASVGGGYSNSATGGDATVGGGHQNTASGPYATIPGGMQAQATLHGQMAYAAGAFATAGDAQTSLYVLRQSTIGSAWTELFLDGFYQRLTLPVSRTMVFDILIVGRSIEGESAGYRATGVIERVGNTTALVGPVVKTVLGEDDSVWDANVQADDLYDALRIEVQGNIGDSVRWVALVRAVEAQW